MKKFLIFMVNKNPKSMITRENLREVIDSLDDKTKKRILSSDKYYVVLTLHIFNTGAYATARLTNDYGRYQHAWKHGNCILCIEDVQSILKDLSTKKLTL